jgi:hypothetical protein
VKQTVIFGRRFNAVSVQHWRKKIINAKAQNGHDAKPDSMRQRRCGN